MGTYDDERHWTRSVAYIAVVMVVGLGTYTYGRGGGSNPPPGLRSPIAAAVTVAPTPTSAPENPTATTVTEVAGETAGEAAGETTGQSATDVVDGATPTSQAADPALDTGLPATTSVVAGDDATDQQVVPALPTAEPAAPVDLGYPATPDGTPLPVIATYEVGRVTLTGHAPSEAARDRLVALAAANSQDQAEVVDRMIVNELVPPNVGVRVIETNSPRFSEGDAKISHEHAEQLNRVVTIMKALPHVTVLVVGHADQRGDAGQNFALSHDRARAVLDYLVFLGVEPTRITASAAGETHLLTLDDDAAALALNRRTEFVFFGVLVD